jgi:uroporphyrinogen decarboxylase
MVAMSIEEQMTGAGGFVYNYFPSQHIRWLTEIICGLSVDRLPSELGLGYGIDMDLLSPPLVPDYKPAVISEDERTVTLINGAGQTIRVLKDYPNRMPTFLDWPVKDRATWNAYKRRLDPNTPERWPADWNTYVQEMNGISEPLCLEVGSFYCYLREWVGSERILYMFYDDPGLIEDMMEQVLYLETEVIKRTLKDIKVQQAHFCEDVAYKAGPLISPAMVRKFMIPRYKKITDLLHNYGVDVINVDSDGNLNELIPLWLEVGINFPAPLEVAAHNDAVALRKKYGKNLILGGNIDKRTLIKGKEAIREEVMSKVPFLLEQGGYFPSVDHSVPPDVTFENYCYYFNLMREVAGLEKLSFY